MRSTGAGTYRSLLKIQKRHRIPPSTLIHQHFHVAVMSEDEGAKGSGRSEHDLAGAAGSLALLSYLFVYLFLHLMKQVVLKPDTRRPLWVEAGVISTHFSGENCCVALMQPLAGC